MTYPVDSRWNEITYQDLMKEWSTHLNRDVDRPRCGVGWVKIIDSLFRNIPKYDNSYRQYPVMIESDFGVIRFIGLMRVDKNLMKAAEMLSSVTCQSCGENYNTKSELSHEVCEECQKVMVVMLQ